MLDDNQLKEELGNLTEKQQVKFMKTFKQFNKDEDVKDFEEDLESQIADIKQCNLEGGPDHIHAARFLGRFVENDTPWLHVDLSSSNRKGGLGAISSDVNGFGVSFGIKMLENLIKK